MKNIDWTKQHCGVHQASFEQLVELMPDLECIKDSFPENVNDFTWDVKVHMLMPNQFPCIPNWHFDNVPRLNNKQDFDAVKLDKHMHHLRNLEKMVKLGLLSLKRGLNSHKETSIEEL